MMDLLGWLYNHWNVTAPFLAAILPFFVKLPFIEHSPVFEFIITKILARMLPTPDPLSESARSVAEKQSPKI